MDLSSAGVNMKTISVIKIITMLFLLSGSVSLLAADTFDRNAIHASRMGDRSDRQS